MKYDQELPKEIEARLDAYIERVKAIKWFQPTPDLKKEDVEKQVSVVLKAFGVEAGIEFKKLETSDDWDQLLDLLNCVLEKNEFLSNARDYTWNKILESERDTALSIAWTIIWDEMKDSNGEFVKDTLWGAENILVEDLDDFKQKYPNGTFINLISLWEMGLAPLGVVNGKFLIYIPTKDYDFPEFFTS